MTKEKISYSDAVMEIESILQKIEDRRDLPDRLRPDPEGRRADLDHPDRGARRRCYRHVRHGGLGLQLEPGALQHLPDTAKILLTSGLLPAAFLAIILNLVLPEELGDEQTEEMSGGMAGHKHDDHV